MLWRFLKLPTSIDRPLPLNRRPETIGGSPQVIRIRPGAVATPFVVRWGRRGNEGDFLFGRRILAQENLDLPLVMQGGKKSGLVLQARSQWEPLTG